jgi:hypothetical protein
MTISKNFAQDATPEEADLMAIVQKPFNQSKRFNLFCSPK